MPDFFEKQDKPEESVVETPEKIKLGDKEYTTEDLQGLVELGKIGREAEEKYNTKLDRVWSDYGKTKNELKSLRDEYEGYKNTTQAPVNVSDEESIKQAKEAAKKLGLVTNDDFENYLEKSFRTRYLQERGAEKILETASNLESKYNGTDGRPKFRIDDILEYMRETGVNDPERAYKLKFENEIDRWKDSQLEKNRKTGFYTEDGVGATIKAPNEVKVTAENISRMMREALNGQ